MISSSAALTKATQGGRSRRDPFDPQRRGAPVPHGRRGPVLTRKARREHQREIEAQAERAALREDQHLHRLAAALARVHNATIDPSSGRWSMPLNVTGQLINLSLYLFAPYDAPARIAGTVRAVRPVQVFEVPDADVLVPVNATGSTRGADATAAANAQSKAWPTAWPPADATRGTRTHAAVPSVETIEASDFNTTRFADRVVASWIKQRCHLALQLERQARGLRWQPDQAALTRLTQRPCRILFNDQWRKSRRDELTRPTEVAFQLELSRIETLLLSSKGSQRDHTRAGRDAHERGTGVSAFMRRASGDPPPTHWPDVRAAQRYVKFPEGKRQSQAIRHMYECLAQKLAEFLQGPCGALVRDFHERRCAPEPSRFENMGSLVCDFIYQATPFGQGASLFGYLVELTSKVFRGGSLTPEDMLRGLSFLNWRFDGHQQVEVGNRRMLWTSQGLKHLHEGEHGTTLVHERPRSALASSARMPDLPVRHTAQGWVIEEIPHAYRVRGVDADVRVDPASILQTGATAGYVQIGEATYEVRQDGRSTRWRIVPPEGKAGMAIPIEFDRDSRRWEPIRLIGAGDPPPLPERYAARDAQWRTGADREAYIDAHEQTYDSALLPEDADDTPLDTLIEQFAGDESLTSQRAGALHQYIEVRSWNHIMESFGHAAREMVNRSPEARLQYFYGLLRGDVTRVAGYRRTMRLDELAALVIGAELTPYEAGACAMQMSERMVRAETHRAAERIMLSSQRAEVGALRSDQIAVPGLTADSTFEDMLTVFLYGRMTDTQFGALQPRIGGTVQRLHTRRNGINRVIETTRESTIPGEADALRSGFENYRKIRIEGIGPETEIEALLDAAQGFADEPTMLGALDHWIQDHLAELDVLEQECLGKIDEFLREHASFVAGVNEATHIELPRTPHGTATELAAVFFSRALTSKQRGAVYGRFREVDALDRIDAVLDDLTASGHAERIKMGYEHPERVSIDGITQLITLEQVAERVERGALTPIQIGRLSRIADDLAADANEARFDARRHRMVTGPEFDDYLTGYFEARRGERPDLAEMGPEGLVELFRLDGGGAKVRGQIAYYITKAEVAQAERDRAMMTFIFAGLRPVRRVVFSQTELPRMFHGLLDGSCYPLVATMAVAMHRGDTAVAAFIARVRRVQPEAVPSSLGATVVLDAERREFYGAFAALAVRQPRSRGALAAGEVTMVQRGIDWEDIRGIVDEAIDDLEHDITLRERDIAVRARQGHARPDPVVERAEIQAFNEHASTSYMIETERHALLVRIEYEPGARSRVAVRFYEPTYGILTFDSIEQFNAVLHRIFESGYYMQWVLGGKRRVNLYGLDPARLGDVRIRGSLFVKDLVEEKPFIQPEEPRRGDNDAQPGGAVEGSSGSVPGRGAESGEPDGVVAGPSGWVPGRGAEPGEPDGA
ncbi:MAG TPA: hypothetical protein VL424_14010, partial [Pararobbsia sp.]|nr:hypothetical protein [Pararobbsia sp.]